MRVAVLGPVQVYADDGIPIDMGGPRLRRLLARLALSTGQVVQAESLVDALWGERPPAGAANALRALVYRLRKALGSVAIESVATGYRLRMRAQDVDVNRFEELAVRGRRELAADRPDVAAALLDDALALWQGPALADVLDAPFAATAAARLEELRIAAAEDRFEAGLRLGRHADILPDLEAVSAAHPLRERLAALHMRALHAAGRQSDALRVFERIRGILADQLGIDPSEELRSAHLAVLRGEREAPRARAEPEPGRLPAPLTSFVGRDDELKTLGWLLESSRLVTVGGPGGAGKTRLAVETASRHRTHRRGRVWLVPLAGTDVVAEAVLGALSSPDARPLGRGSADPVNRVAELLGGAEAVLVLDNCEHLVAEVAEFAGRLLEQQPYLTILATSREPLDIIGEALYRLGPLPQPAAVRLFTDRATAVRPGVALDEETVTDIVRRLDGLPLALELAAARLRTLDADQIARRLDDRFRLLASGNRSAQPRQRTLHAVIEWSWDLLTDQEETLARRMSIFPARTGAAAIEAVCSDQTLPPGDIADVLGSLVDKSIVERTASGYRMLETIRAYAGGKLDLADERDTTRARFTRHFTDLAEDHEPLLRSHEQEASLRVFDTEYDNIVHALRTAIDEDDAMAAARILTALYWYWMMVRYEPRGEAFVARVLEFGDGLPLDARAAVDIMHALRGDMPNLTPDRAEALIEEGARSGALERYPAVLMATLVIGHLTGQDDLVEREIARARGRSDSWVIACTFFVEAIIGHERGDWTAAATALDRACHLLEKTGDRLLTAIVVTQVARARSVGGDHDGAIALYEHSIALTSQHEITHRIALAQERMRAGDLAGARRDLDVAERAAWEKGHQQQQIEVMAALVELHRRSGEVERADRELDRIERIVQESPLLPTATAFDGFVLPARMAIRLTARDAKRARDLLPDVVKTAAGQHDLAAAAQLLATLLSLEGDPGGAATALGMSQVIRGAFDHGDPEIRELAAALTVRLGPAVYDAAYQRGTRLARQEAIDRLAGGASHTFITGSSQAHPIV